MNRVGVFRGTQFSLQELISGKHRQCDSRAEYFFCVHYLCYILLRYNLNIMIQWVLNKGICPCDPYSQQELCSTLNHYTLPDCLLTGVAATGRFHGSLESSFLLQTQVHWLQNLILSSVPPNQHGSSPHLCCSAPDPRTLTLVSHGISQDISTPPSLLKAVSLASAW